MSIGPTYQRKIRTQSSLSKLVFPLRREDVAFPKCISKEGSFGHVRKHDVHTGIDLYTRYRAPVFAMEAGVVVSVEQFTGPPESPWWLPTKALLIEGSTGSICYGEVDPRADVVVGLSVAAGEKIAEVVPVLPQGKERRDIPDHSRFMLHLELYEHGTTCSVWWSKGDPQPQNLRDPMPILAQAWNNLDSCK